MNSHTIRHHITHFPWKAFLLLVLVLYLGHWLGASVHHFVDEATHGFPHHHPWVMAGVSAIILIVLVFALHTLHHQNPRPKSLWFRGLLWAISTLVVVTAYCAATWTEHAVLGFSWLGSRPWLFVLMCLAGLAAVNRVLKDILRGIEGPEDIHQTGYPAEPPGTLVLFVSIIHKDTIEFAREGSGIIVRTGAPGSPPTEYRIAGECIGDDITALHGSRWPWQQLLRAVLPHAGLRKLILVGSSHGFTPDSPGSAALIQDCARMLAPYLPEGCEVVTGHEALPFESFNAVKKALRKIINAEITTAGEGRVMIDVTGGQATTSIAAAAATIGTEALFQYVQTNPPFDVLYYDVHNVNAPGPSH